MHSNSIHARSLARTISRPLILILAGLMVLSAAMLWRNFPAVTGMALVALGATTATAERFCMSNARGLLLVAHFAIYIALYLLFFGAFARRGNRRHGNFAARRLRSGREHADCRGRSLGRGRGLPRSPTHRVLNTRYQVNAAQNRPPADFPRLRPIFFDTRPIAT